MGEGESEINGKTNRRNRKRKKNGKKVLSL